MSNELVDDKIWEALYTTDAPDVPFEAMCELIKKCGESPEVENELIENFEAILNGKDEDWDEGFYWTMVILAKGGSKKSIPLFLRCLSRYSEYDYVLETVHQCLIWLGEPAVREVMVWMKQKRSFVEKLYAAGVFESVLDYGDEALLIDVKKFLKEQVALEEVMGDEEDCLSQYLIALAYFPGEDVLPFVRSVVSRFEFHPDFNDAFEIAEGRFPFERENEYARDWKKFCKSSAERLDLNIEKKEKEHGKYIEGIYRELTEALKTENWAKVLVLGKELKKERNLKGKISTILSSAYVKLKMKKEFEVEIREALDFIGQSWKLFPELMNYKEDIELLEILRSSSEFASEDERLFLVSRFGDYMVGLLEDIGYADYHLAIKKIKKMVSTPDVVSEEILRRFFETEKEMFILKDKYIALKSVKDLNLLVHEFEKRKLSPIFPNSLTKMKLMQEGRRHQFYTKEEAALDQEIRIFTLGRWNLELFRKEMRNDIAGYAHRDGLINKMRVYFENFPRLVDCIFDVWNLSPRWELGGRAPRELNDFAIKSQMGDRTKIGRNDLCPCGSGKKYKKCCSNKGD